MISIDEILNIRKLIDANISEYVMFKPGDEYRLLQHEKRKKCLKLPKDITYLGEGIDKICFLYRNCCIKYVFPWRKNNFPLKREIQMFQQYQDCFPKLYSYDQNSYEWEVCEFCFQCTNNDVKIATYNIYEQMQDLEYPINLALKRYSGQYQKILDDNTLFENSQNNKARYFFSNLMQANNQQRVVFDKFFDIFIKNNLRLSLDLGNHNWAKTTRYNQQVLLLIDAGNIGL